MTTEKKYSLDLFKEVLPALYKGKLDFFENLSEKEQKEITPFTLMKWLSSAGGFEELAPILINDLVNKGFWDLSHHKELQWKILCVVASEISNRVPRHSWISMKKESSSTPKLDKLILFKYPLINDNEVELYKYKFSGKEEVKEFCLEFGLSDTEIKEVVKEYDKKIGKNHK